ncbi:MAG TPA: ABC transporter ATP-binding protein [Phycisphaerae bacterium]|nr:ABC transporter ATP-binding protein [Phycisphaerae bacterium]
MNGLIVVEDLIKSYVLGDEKIQALAGVNLSVPRGAFAAIMGASGSGKTTLLHLIGGLDSPDSGRVLIGGESISEMSDDRRTIFRRRRMGIVFQSFNLLPSLTALENVMLPLLVDGQAADPVRKRAQEMLDSVHLSHRTRHRPMAMSGGEQQRVAIARALMNQPEVILADEPTGNLDPTSSVEIWRLMRSLCTERNMTVLMVTHEPHAAAHADIVHILKAGQLTGIIDAGGHGDATLVASRYAQLAN